MSGRMSELSRLHSRTPRTFSQDLKQPALNLATVKVMSFFRKIAKEMENLGLVGKKDTAEHAETQLVGSLQHTRK